jgi:dihydroxyacetone kinase-like predicted kinase
MTPSALLTHAELLIAGATLAGIAKSWYNGTIGDALEAIGSIGSIEQKVDHIEERQEQMAQQQDKMVDGVVALSISQEREGAEVDTDQLIQELRDGRGVQIFLENREPQNPYASGWDVEDEREEVRENDD